MTGVLASAFASAAGVADAVLYEGYLLYPYRASADKNRMRWQFGVLVPPDAADALTGESASSRTECLCEPGTGAMLSLRLRFLHVVTRTVEVVAGSDFVGVERYTTADGDYSSWEEAAERTVDTAVQIADLITGGAFDQPFTIGASEETESIDSGAARLVRYSAGMSGVITVSAVELAGPFGGVRLRVVVTNTTPAGDPIARGAAADGPVDGGLIDGGSVGGGSAGGRRDAGGPVNSSREAALPRSFLGAHVLLALSDGSFLSLADPPEWARVAASECVNERAWPVLVGDEVRRDMMLSAPIILGDFPAIAPESPGPLFDGTEIDEILTLRTMTLTEAEKREARATDPRARDLLDRVDSMPPELLDRLHGTVRYLRQVTGETSRSAPADPAGTADPRSADPFAADPAADPFTADPFTAGPFTADPVGTSVPWWDPAADASVDPDTDAVVIAGVPVAKGSRVWLAPRTSGTDAQDMFLAGLAATVQAVVFDVDGTCHLAVTIDDDPAAEVQSAHGRFRYFSPDEVVPERAT